MKPNIHAFLDLIAYSEGTIGRGDDGYNVLVGGKLFTSYDDHPRQLVQLNKTLASTAAGRYQILKKYYDFYTKELGLTGFSSEVQDVIAIYLLVENKALHHVIAGRIELAIKRVKNIWASFPGAGYGQREHKLEELLDKFVEFGGVLAKKI